MIAFIIWLIGWFVAYAIIAKVISNNPTASKEWDNVYRGFCIVISIFFSWVVVLVCLVILAVQEIRKYKVFSNRVVPFLKKLEPKGLSKG